MQLNSCLTWVSHLPSAANHCQLSETLWSPWPCPGCHLPAFCPMFSPLLGPSPIPCFFSQRTRAQILNSVNKCQPGALCSVL